MREMSGQEYRTRMQILAWVGRVGGCERGAEGEIGTYKESVENKHKLLRDSRNLSSGRWISRRRRIRSICACARSGGFRAENERWCSRRDC